MKIDIFKDELDMISSDIVYDFTISALKDAPNSLNQESYINYIKGVVENVGYFSDFVGLEETGKDCMISAALIHDIYELDYREYHPLVARKRLKPYSDIFDDEEVFDSIMRLVEGHEGLNSCIPQVVPESIVEQGFAFCVYLTKNS